MGGRIAAAVLAALIILIGAVGNYYLVTRFPDTMLIHFVVGGLAITGVTVIIFGVIERIQKG